MIISHGILLLVKSVDNLPAKWKYLPYLTIPLSYIIMRLIFLYYPVEFSNSASILIMILSTVIATLLLLQHETNKLKSKTKMKQLRVEDGPKRPIGK